MPMWFFVLLLTLGASLAQNEGIKSIKGGSRHGNLQDRLQFESHMQNYSDAFMQGYINRTRVPPPLLHRVQNNATDYFGSIPSGICFKEVPTASLVHNPNIPIPHGNGSSGAYSKIQVCCEGFERNPHVFTKCDPICEPECINARCIGPNKCKCYPDHVQDLAGFCHPTCPIGCFNGVCYGDRCSCHQGYTLDESGRICLPKCSHGCANGNCTAPETCTCNVGFQRNENGQCVPHCTNCIHGDCVAPEECRCHIGYAKEEKFCEPQCPSGCINGYCAAPGVCACNPGLELDAAGKNCVAYCSLPCLNGECTGPDTCTCKRGYIKDPADPTGTKCIGHCPNGCPNGVCSGPNFCLCNVGFVKDRSVKGSQVCVRRL